MKKIPFIILALIMITLTSFSITGQEVLDEMEANNQDFESSMQIYELTLIGSDGEVENVKEMATYILVEEKDGEKESLTMMRINKPRNLEGTTVMTLSEDEQYVYMPSYRKVKRITGNSKNDSFLDTDFKYSDISLLSGEVKEDNVAELIEENDESYVIKVDITDTDTDYDYMIMKVSKDYLLQGTEFYAENDKKIKTMVVSDYREVDGRNIFERLEIEDHEKNHKTVMDLLEAEFDIPITKKFFSTLNMTSKVLRYR